MATSASGPGRPELTLDTSPLLELWKQQDKSADTQRLLDLAAAGEVDLAVTRYIRDDVPDQPLASKINELHSLNVTLTGGVFQLDVHGATPPSVVVHLPQWFCSIRPDASCLPRVHPSRCGLVRIGA